MAVTAERYLAGLAKAGIRPSLERIREALEAFGRPDRRCKVILVTGTNGKGTCAKALAEIFRAHGRRVGLYLSPHLFSYTERYEIDGKKISAREFQRETLRQRRLLDSRGLRLTEFEFLTLLAYRLFARSRVEAAVVEVGMGGRWDATNAADPCLSIITGVGIDHVQFLGPDEKSIAFDKAHVARKHRPLLVGPVSPDVRRVVAQTAGRIGARVRFLTAHAAHVNAPSGKRRALRHVLDRYGYDAVHGAGWRLPLPSDIFGVDYELAVLAARRLLGRAFRKDHTQRAILRAVLPGRFEQRRRQRCRVLFDVAHNGQALEALFRCVRRRLRPRRIHVVLGMQSQKRGEEQILPYLQACDAVRLARIPTPLSKPPALWRPFRIAARRRRIAVTPPAPIASAFRRALASAGPADILVVTGSFYTVRASRPLCA